MKCTNGVEDLGLAENTEQVIFGEIFHSIELQFPDKSRQMEMVRMVTPTLRLYLVRGL